MKPALTALLIGVLSQVFVFGPANEMLAERREIQKYRAQVRVLRLHASALHRQLDAEQER